METVEKNDSIVIYIGPECLIAFKGMIRGEDAQIKKYVKQIFPEGFARGFVSHLEKAGASLQALLRELGENTSNSEIRAYVVLSNSQIRQYQYTSSIYYHGENRTITPHEILAVLEQTKNVATLPLDQHILHTLPDSFIVNDHYGIQNPLGLDAGRLGVELNLFTMQHQDFKNLSKLMELAEVEVLSYFPSLFGILEGILTSEEKSQGAIVFDVSQETTQLLLSSQGSLTGVKSLNFGTNEINQRIAEEWGLQAQDSERLKDQYGSFNLIPEFSEELIPLIERQGIKKNLIKRQEFQDFFIQFGYDWLSKLLKESQELLSEMKMNYPHFIFTGSGAHIDGLIEFIQRRFSRVARIGLPKKVDAPQELLVDPSVAAAVASFRWLVVHEKEQRSIIASTNFLQRTLSSARDWFLNYF